MFSLFGFYFVGSEELLEIFYLFFVVKEILKMVIVNFYKL